MDTNSVWDLLSSISIGTIVAWITVICAIISAICLAAIKSYKIFVKYKNIQDERDDLRIMVKDHDEKLSQISQQLSQIQEDLEQNKAIKLKELRHSIIRAGEEAVVNKSITIRSLKSLEELHDDYVARYNGNGYVDTLMEKVRDLPVIGNLDSNYRDIETTESNIEK